MFWGGMLLLWETGGLAEKSPDYSAGEIPRTLDHDSHSEIKIAANLSSRWSRADEYSDRLQY